jgi:hypothetical protein
MTQELLTTFMAAVEAKRWFPIENARCKQWAGRSADLQRNGGIIAN